MTETTKVKAKARVSNWHKLMGGLYAISLLAAIPGSLAFMAIILRGSGLFDLALFKNLIALLPQIVGTVLLTFLPATAIAFLAPDN